MYKTINSLENEKIFRKNVIQFSSFWIGTIVIVSAFIRHLIAPMPNIVFMGIGLSTAFLFTAAALIKWNYKDSFAGAFLVSGIFILSVNAGIANGGLAAPVTVGFILLPIVGSVANGNKGSIFGLALSFIGILFLIFAEKYGFTLPNNPINLSLYKGFIFITISIVSFAIALLFEKSRTDSEKNLIQQREFISGILDTTPAVIFLVTSDGHVLSTNQNGLNFLNLKSNEIVVGKNIIDIFDSNYNTHFKKIIKETILYGNSKNFEFPLLKENHSKKWFNIQCSKFNNLSDESQCLITMFDITDQKFSEFLKSFHSSIMTLIARKENLDIILNKIIEEIEIYDPEIKCKIQFESVVGFKKSENKILPTLSMNRIDFQNKSHIEEMIYETASQLISLAFQYIKAEKELENQKIKLITNSKMAALGEMSSGIAHEINNPVAIIVGKTEVIKQNLLKAAPQEKILSELSKITKAAFRISTIVKGLKSFTRNSENDPMVQIKLYDILDEVMNFYTEKFKYNNIELRNLIIPSNEITLLGRQAQIEQVLVNLINNSIDAIANNEEKWVEISMDVSNSKIKIRIKDSGNGIPIENQDKIMNPFFTTKEVGKGTGLGLSISKGIIEEHKGNFYFDTQSKNTCFVVELPIFTNPNITAA